MQLFALFIRSFSYMVMNAEPKSRAALLRQNSQLPDSLKKMLWITGVIANYVSRYSRNLINVNYSRNLRTHNLLPGFIKKKLTLIFYGPAAPDHQHACGGVQGRLGKIGAATKGESAWWGDAGHAALRKMSLPRPSRSKAISAACDGRAWPVVPAPCRCLFPTDACV